jgi:ABC-type lipoprotein release transport system permease subunit
VREASPKRSNGPLSGMRGVVLGVGLGVLAAKKVPPLVQNLEPLVQNAMLKYVTSHATGATDQAPSPDQAAGGSPAA